MSLRPPRDTALPIQYLVEHRKLAAVESLQVGHCLRWHEKQQAIVALMVDPRTGEFTGVHRTFLNADGSKRERKMLGRKGVICLSRIEDVTTRLGICEGLEDGLALLLAGCGPIWVACDAGGVARFPILNGIEALTIFADNDEAGIRAAKECARRWYGTGEVRIKVPRRSAR